MTVEAVVRFFEEASVDRPLRGRLAGLIGVGDGDVSASEALDAEEAEALLGNRSVQVARLAHELGFDFTVGEIALVVNAFRRHQSGELSESEMASALGVGDPSARIMDMGSSIEMVYLGTRYSRSRPTSSDRTPQVIEFVRKTSDPDVRNALREILKVGDGDISSFNELDFDEQQALASERAVLVADFAAQHGYDFTMADLIAVIDAFGRLKRGEMSEETFDNYVQMHGSAADSLPLIEQVKELTYKGIDYESARPTPSKDNPLEVVRFMEKSSKDEQLKRQLQDLIGGDGDISAPGELDAEEAHSLIGDRSEQIVELGAKHGFRFRIADLSAVVGAFRLVDSGDLPLVSCMRILGLRNAEGVTDGLAEVTATASRIYRGVRY